MNKLVLLISVLLMTSCTMYEAPSADDPRAAMLYDSSKDFGVSSYLSAKVTKLDGHNTTMLGLTEGKFPVLEGVHDVFIVTTFKPSTYGAQYKAGTQVRAKFLAGKSYRVRTSIEGLMVNNWIVDMDSDKAVSTVASDLGADTTPRTTYISIYSPKKR